ncbi:MAG: hypothetical protein GEU80_09640 [Dehalococcoidia bacterium]|nr:hypothetical protein [Dehalococcoidia bacterium]
MSCPPAVLTADGPGTFAATWSTGAEAGAQYELAANLSSSADTSDASAVLRYGLADGSYVSVTGPAPEGAVVSVRVEGHAEGAGATLTIDALLLTMLPAPPIEESPTATPTSTGTPGPSPTPSPTATPTPTPTPPPVVGGLVNGDFGAMPALVGWTRRGGSASVRDGWAALVSTSDSTKYLQQSVPVEPGQWYEAAAVLQVTGAAEAGWVRIAWYPSTDGGGSQLSTVDSEAMTGGLAVVTTGPVQAPPGALSATVRLMLRPYGSVHAELLADLATFLPAAAPPPPTPSPTPTPTPTAAPTATATPSATATPRPPPAATSGPSGFVGPAGPAGPSGGALPGAGAGGAATEAGTGGLVRITELLPNPTEPGRDTDWEWIELTNVGLGPASLAGLSLRDNAGPVDLPAMVLAPGASVVIAGPLGAVGEAAVFRPATGLGNGLGNAGDRLLLTDAGGEVLDALSYGEDVTYASSGPALLSAPGPGQSIERWFDAAGVLLGSRIAPRPSPGTMHVPAGIEGASEGSTALDGSESQSGEPARESIASGTPDRLGWIVALTFVAGGLAGVTAIRVLGGGRNPTV